MSTPIAATENTVPVAVSMRVKCWCGYANDEDFVLDMPHKAQPTQAYELSACPDCGAPIRIHLKRWPWSYTLGHVDPPPWMGYF